MEDQGGIDSQGNRLEIDVNELFSRAHEENDIANGFMDRWVLIATRSVENSNHNSRYCVGCEDDGGKVAIKSTKLEAKSLWLMYPRGDITLIS